jgi:hypothetical protein
MAPPNRSQPEHLNLRLNLRERNFYDEVDVQGTGERLGF